MKYLKKFFENNNDDKSISCLVELLDEGFKITESLINPTQLIIGLTRVINLNDLFKGNYSNLDSNAKREIAGYDEGKITCDFTRDNFTKTKDEGNDRYVDGNWKTVYTEKEKYLTSIIEDSCEKLINSFNYPEGDFVLESKYSAIMNPNSFLPFDEGSEDNYKLIQKIKINLI
jgi:hypothetical protein